ncbi:response regulator [Halocola ammonii]
MKKIDIACIIDDDPIYVFGAKRVMELADFCKSYLIFHNGEDALNQLSALIEKGDQEALPDLILLDLNMPIMDGWQFLEEFSRIPCCKKITIFIVSSSVNPSDIEKAKEYSQVSDYLIKPVTMQRLKEVLMT